ncbi:unnamed protein product [Orchesella dallaii]|uniref:Uncharacterized protein n=1 Tax=Orchesella dallaii TaxID=48710 RepID=A0ABP1RHV5_9HEXA
MAQQSFQETTQCDSSEDHSYPKNGESECDPNHRNEDFKAQFEILTEKYFHLETNHEFLKDKFETVRSNSVPAIQYEEILEQNKNLLETNQNMNKLNAVLLKVSQSGNFGKEGGKCGKVSTEAQQVLRDIQKLIDELKKDTKNSAESLNRVEEFDKLNRKQLEEISVLVGCVEGHMGKAYELEEKLYRKEIQHKIEIDRLNKSYGEASTQLTRLQYNLKFVYAEKEELQQMIQHCYSENSQLKKRNEEFTSKYEEEIHNLKEQLKLKEADVIEARETNEKLQKQMKNLECTLVSEHKQDETVAQLQSRYDELLQQNRDQLNRNQELEGRILVHRWKIRRLQKDALRIQNINLKKDLKEANAEIIKLVEDTEQIKQMYVTEIENLNKKLDQANTNRQQGKERNTTQPY